MKHAAVIGGTRGIGAGVAAKLLEKGWRVTATGVTAEDVDVVLAYRRLVTADERTAPSFLFESVDTGGTVGRF